MARRYVFCASFDPVQHVGRSKGGARQRTGQRASATRMVATVLRESTHRARAITRCAPINNWYQYYYFSIVLIIDIRKIFRQQTS